MAACTCADPTLVARVIAQAGNQNQSAIAATNTQLNFIHETMYGSGMSGGPPGYPGAPAPVRFCRWAAPEISDSGENAWATLFRAASIAIAIANGLAQAEISDKQQDLAEGYYQQAKFKWDRFKEKYMPLEKKLLQEVSTTPIRELNCVDDRDRAQVSVNTAYDNMNAFLARQARRLRVCLDPSLLAVVNQKQATALVDTENYNLVDDQWFTDYSNDKRWNRRSVVLNLGRNLSVEALKYGDVARQLYGQVGAQLDRAAGGVMAALGYYGARNDTYYPTTYLGSNGGAGNAQLVSTAVPSGLSIGSAGASGGNLIN